MEIKAIVPYPIHINVATGWKILWLLLRWFISKSTFFFFCGVSLIMKAFPH